MSRNSTVEKHSTSTPQIISCYGYRNHKFGFKNLSVINQKQISPKLFLFKFNNKNSSVVLEQLRVAQRVNKYATIERRCMVISIL